MAKDEFIQEFEQVLTQIAVGKVKLKVLKMQARLHLHNKATQETEKKSVRNRIEEFIDSHPDLEPEDIEFLRLGEATTAEVAKYLTENSIYEIHRDTVSRKIGDWYQAGPNSTKSKRTVDTISVIERHFYRGDTKTSK